MFAEIVFPLPFRNTFTYSVPEELVPFARIGVRALVPFGKRMMTGFIVKVSETSAIKEKVKPVSDILDSYPVFSEKSLEFYNWLADYYLSSLGEALKNSVPYGLEIETKKKIVSDRQFCGELLNREKNKNSIRAKLLRVLSEREISTTTSLQKELHKKNIYAILRDLEDKGAVTILNELGKAKVSVKTQKVVQLDIPADEVFGLIPEIERRSPKQVVIILHLLAKKGKEVLLSELLKNTQSSQSSVSSLEEKGYIKVFDKEITRTYTDQYSEEIKTFQLTEKQASVVNEISDSISNSEFVPYLLHGVTGSGKTQVYIELAKKALEKEKSVLLLVPEISLTPQITSRLYNSFGGLVSVLHSRISLGERYDAWRGIIKGKHKIVVGPRSALFAPLPDLGLIVVDEEHDASYKQYDLIPRYHARDSAVVLAKLNNCPVVLGSATPSVETMYNARKGKYRLLELPERVDDATLPEIKLVNVLIERKRKRMENVFSKFLIDHISDRIKKKEGVILLQNRRGFATQVYCEDCGEIETCSDCSVPLVYHINKNILKCHYCGFSKNVPHACSTCGSLSIKYMGTGTQRVEDELDYYFPDARIERIDSDSIGKKGALGLVLNNFRKGEVDILVGTQMVSKGLDFANVTLVGVISAETNLWLPDFRADERTFQLLTQVSGRAGRSKIKGEVIIQTQNEKNFVLQRVLANDYAGFYEHEIKLREERGYPPFTRICLIESRDENESNARGALTDFYNIITTFKYGLRITPPSEAIIAKIKKNYRFHILIKNDKRVDPNGNLLRKAVLESYVLFNQKSRYRNIQVSFDIDPQSVL